MARGSQHDLSWRFKPARYHDFEHLRIYNWSYAIA